MPAPTPSTSWVKLRVKTNPPTADTDHVDAQSSPTSTELYRVGRQQGVSGATPVGLQIMVTWVNNVDEILTPAAGTGRGVFDIEVLKVLSLQDEDAPADAATVVGDSTKLTGCIAYRIYQVDGMTGDQIWIRLSGITNPAAGSPAKMQVWICPVERA